MFFKQPSRSPSFASSSSTASTQPTTTTTTTKPKTLYIFDARPFKNAIANYTAGGGYESKKNYPSCEVDFLDIENIHAMRDSLGTTNSSSEQFVVSTLENSKWLQHIRCILGGALKIVSKISDGYPVLVHCSDGWDRTAQVMSIIQVGLETILFS